MSVTRGFPAAGRAVRRIPRRLRAAAWRWRRARRGAALVEFALVLPVMIGLMVGCIEMAALVAAKGRVSDVAATVGDLVAQNRVMDEIRIKDVFAATEAVMESGVLQGAAGSEITVTVTSALACQCAGDPESYCFSVLWSHKYQNGAVTDGLTPEDPMPEMPSSLAFGENETLIVTEVTYAYHAPLEFVMDGGVLEMEDIAYFRPRFSDRVEHLGGQAEDSMRICE